jgi:hypothetical protein
MDTQTASILVRCDDKVLLIDHHGIFACTSALQTQGMRYFFPPPQSLIKSFTFERALELSFLDDGQVDSVTPCGLRRYGRYLTTIADLITWRSPQRR